MGEEEIVEFGDFQIWNQSTEVQSSYVIREFVLTKSSVSYLFTNFHFLLFKFDIELLEYCCLSQHLSVSKQCGEERYNVKNFIFGIFSHIF